MSEEHKKALERSLWAIADSLRGKMNADDYRDYILGFIFYKYLSEKIEFYANKILEPDGLKFVDLDQSDREQKEIIELVREEAVEKLGYFLKPSELFTTIAKRGHIEEDENYLDDEENETRFILEDLGKILNNIQASTMGTESEEDFDNLFEDIDLNNTKLGRTTEQRNRTVSKILTMLDQIDFALGDTERDVLGDAYEYLIGEFAAGAGKKAGEFYTPQEVSKILAKLVTSGRRKLKSVYDPTCGSGSLLLRVAKEVEEVGHFYGQEMNRTTYNLARMNMILHDVNYRQFDIKLDDTLERPGHMGKTFQAIVANPPFSAVWSARQSLLTDDRFNQYGSLAPSSKADFAFVQHMIHHLDEDGAMAIVLPHGVLFRGGAEQSIRQYLIEELNYLDAVIGLPSNIFFGTSIPTCILVFKKCRENPDDVLFIDASQGFTKEGNKNKLKTGHIDKIISTYRHWTEEAKYSKRSPIKTHNELGEKNENSLEGNGYNLNIPRYVDTFEEADAINLEEVAGQLVELENALKENDLVLESFCKELGIGTPFNIENGN